MLKTDETELKSITLNYEDGTTVTKEEGILLHDVEESSILVRGMTAADLIDFLQYFLSMGIDKGFVPMGILEAIEDYLEDHAEEAVEEMISKLSEAQDE